MAPDYLMEELPKRLAASPAKFRIALQIAEYALLKINKLLKYYPRYALDWLATPCTTASQPRHRVPRRSTSFWSSRACRSPGR